MEIRRASRKDAGNLAALFNHVEDSGYMLFNPGERKATAKQMEKQLEQIEKNPSSIVLVSASGNELTGYLILLGNQMGRTRHSAKIVIGIHEQVRGKGIGTKLFQKMEEHARTNEIRRLELSVIANNAPALSLYHKMGFEKEGIKRESLFFDGKYHDEYFLSKLL
ncbi:GNAT family N-acetyltransferase [Peribacillus frigoritolerans]|uniref:GNAT family N-acetyltransferase n=1 Tax=Peribacillus frigoritolerans TaxID=450367 RepID=UPI00215A12FC|nr:GNAT family N-acetyltransferase [Peribacillus frigoritolerans]MCR8869744.1 GNAT family N-acetyltransferase [Peribacillus frigoritolerans]